MSLSLRLLAPGLVLLTAATAFAQAPSAPPQRPDTGMNRPDRQPPSPETMQRLLDGRIAMIRTSLKLTDAQAKLFQPVEAELRKRQQTRLTRMQERQAQRATGTPPSATDRLERRTAMQAERAATEKAFLDVLTPFLAGLTEEQKPIAERLLVDHGGGRRGFAGHGPRHGGGQKL